MMRAGALKPQSRVPSRSAVVRASRPRRGAHILAYRETSEPATSTTSSPPPQQITGNGYYSNQQREREDEARPALSGIPRGSVWAVVLGGGESDSRRLFPLTEKRTLPAIPVGGIYRLIDVPLSNLINSGINRVYVLTQYNSTSLNRYLHSTYGATTGSPTAVGGFVEVVAATQGPNSQRWAEGAVDTVRQWHTTFASSYNSQLRAVQDVLVLPSDQVYQMDFEALVDAHHSTDADLTLVCRPVKERDVDHVGVIKLAATSGQELGDYPSHRIESFKEKPTGEDRAEMSMDMEDIMAFLQGDKDKTPGPVALPAYMEGEQENKVWLGSCGMYLFKKEALEKILQENPKARDFGRELIPAACKAGLKVNAFNFTGFWVDIGGSIQDFYDFNMALTRDEVQFSFTDQRSPFYAGASLLPPNRYNNVQLSKTLVGNGCQLDNCKISSSVVGSRALIGAGTRIEDSIIMGSDYYESEKTWTKKVGPQFPHMGIGTNCVIKKAIVDKNTRIGNNVQLVNKEGVFESMDRMAQGIAIRDGIIIVSKSSVVPDGTVV